MEYEIIKWVVLTLFSGVLYFMKRTMDLYEHRIDELERTQQDIKKEYLHKEDFKDFKVELRSMFEEIKTDIRELKRQ